MTPDQLELIVRDSAVVSVAPGDFAAAFYATLFELAPTTRPLFPDDMTEQSAKLTSELSALIDVATAWQQTGAIDGFVERARQLGARHRGYGVSSAMYAPVGVALIAALRSCVDGFDDEHARAWSTLYHLLADTMREGALADGHPTT
jgi:nitric oxide dioxygenase